jgi:hypothetical protein
MAHSLPVIPAKAGIQEQTLRRSSWTPDFAGATNEKVQIPRQGE